VIINCALVAAQCAGLITPFCIAEKIFQCFANRFVGQFSKGFSASAVWKMDSIIECTNSYFVKNCRTLIFGKFKVRLGGQDFDDLTAALAEIVKIYLDAARACAS
jgi:hypothetical protein